MHEFMQVLVRWAILGIELAAVAAIAAGFVWSGARALVVNARDKDQRHAVFRRGLGRSTLIALELLVAADILRSVVLEPSLANICRACRPCRYPHVLELLNRCRARRLLALGARQIAPTQHRAGRATCV